MNQFVNFLEPAFLILLVLVPLLWFIPRRVRDVRHGVLRSLVVALVVFALARPALVRDDAVPSCVLIVDGSASVDDRAALTLSANEAMAAMPSNARVLLIEIGDSVLKPDLDVERRVHLTGGRSPLGDALRLAAAHVPAGSPGAVTIVSDGRATDQHWATATQALVARGVPVHAVLLANTPGDVGIEGVVTRDDLRIGRAARLGIRLFGGPADVEVLLTGPEGELARSDVTRVEGETTAWVSFEPKAAGYLPVTVALARSTGGDRHPENDTFTTTLAIQDPVRVLYLGQRLQGAGAEVETMIGPGFTVERAEGESLDVANDLAKYDVVVLDDRPANQVPTAFQERLVSAIRQEGLGLLMAGGSGSFGPGGYHETEVASVVPVEFIQKEEKKDPSTALAVIIDTSGSMTGQRIILAKEVTRLAMRRLLPHDKVGIVEFYGAKRWAAPLQSAANAIAIQRALNRLDAGGGTVILPAIEEAYYGMKNVQTRYKHVLILTDAGVEQGAFEPLLRQMAKDGICVSTVLVGPDRHSEFLVQLANWGNGRYYNASDRFNLPEVILKQPSTARLPAYRPGVTNVTARGGAGWWGSLDRSKVPALGGYVETRARPGAEILLETIDNRHPVLATWRRGLGRVTVFMSELAGQGTEPWKDWDGYGPLLARLIARTAADDVPPYRFSLARNDHEMIVTAERRGSSELRPAASLMLKNGPSALAFEGVAPDVFEARFVADPGVEVRVEARTTKLVSSDTSGPTYRMVSPAHEDQAAEFAMGPRGSLDLALLSSATGGVVGGSASWATGGGNAPVRLVSLWPLALILALLCYLGDVAFRRSSWFASSE